MFLCLDLYSFVLFAIDFIKHSQASPKVAAPTLTMVVRDKHTEHTALRFSKLRLLTNSITEKPILRKVHLNAIHGHYYQMSSFEKVHSVIRINPTATELLGATVFCAANRYIYLVHKNICGSVLQSQKGIRSGEMREPFFGECWVQKAPSAWSTQLPASSEHPNIPVEGL